MISHSKVSLCVTFRFPLPSGNSLIKVQFRLIYRLSGEVGYDDRQELPTVMPDLAEWNCPS